MRELDQTSPDAMADIIKSTFVLHNWIIDAKEDESFIVNELADGYPDWMHIDAPVLSSRSRLPGDDARDKRNLLKTELMLL
jgi:hypothetical protein